jgi:hypothetical protein
MAQPHPPRLALWIVERRRQALRSLVPGLRRQWSAARLPASKGRVPMRGFFQDLRFGLRLLRHQPLMAAAGMLASGRALAPEDDRPEAPPALVVSQTFWRKHFGEAALAGQTVLYATMAFAVRRRTREIGVRMALGANVSNLRAMILRQALTLVAAGALFGFAGAYWAGRAISSQLYGVSPADTASLFGAAGILGAAALLATWLPARRATRIDPVQALRD